MTRSGEPSMSCFTGGTTRTYLRPRLRPNKRSWSWSWVGASARGKQTPGGWSCLLGSGLFVEPTPLAVFCLCLFLLFTGLPEGALTGTTEGVGALRARGPGVAASCGFHFES